MIGLISIFFAVLTAIFTYLLKEPEFLKEIEDEYKNHTVDLEQPDSLRIMTKLHLITGIKNFYKFIGVFKSIMIFLILAIIAVGALLALITFLQNTNVNEETISIFCSIVLLFLIFSFMISLYIYLFSLIVKQI